MWFSTELKRKLLFTLLAVFLNGCLAVGGGGEEGEDETPTEGESAITVGFALPVASIAESDSTAIPIVVAVSEAPATDLQLTVEILGDSTATVTDDFTLTSATVTIPAGDTVGSISLSALSDVLNESNETIILSVDVPEGYSAGTYSTMVVTITDDDSEPSISFDSSGHSLAESTTTDSIPVSLSTVAGVNVTVNYAITSGTASGSGVDYTLADGTLTILAGDLTASIPFSINNDALDESAETFVVTISSPAYAALGSTTTHTVTITDNDPTPSVAFGAASSSVSEATTITTIPVALAAPSGLTATVDYTVTGGSATGGGVDYVLASGTLTYSPSDTSESISIVLTNDAIDEVDETVVVSLSNPSNTSLGSTTAHTLTILDNDSAPSVQFVSSSSTSAEATTAPTIDLQLSTASGYSITVNYAVTGGTATGSGTDYTLASGVATFAVGSTTTSIPLSVVNDSLDEINETIVVTISSPSQASLGGTTSHTLTLVDDDASPLLTLAATTSSIAESVATQNYTVSLSEISGTTVTVDYAVTGGTATGSGTDYTLVSGTLTFVPGDTSETIVLSVVDDALDEIDETLTIQLSNPGSASISPFSSVAVTIVDNDSPPEVAFTSGSSSGNESLAANSMTVALSASSGRTVTVDYAVTGGNATGSGTDYTLASGTLTFVPGDVSETISFTIAEDVFDEVNETFVVSVSNPSQATLGAQSTHTYTIVDNDDAPLVSFSPTSASGAESTAGVTLTVQLSAASGNTVNVDYAVSGGSATGGGTDYSFTSGTLTFVPGDTSEQISLTIVEDARDEAAETVIVALSNPILGQVGAGSSYTYTITDNDATPTMSFGSASSSGLESATTVNLPVSLSAVSGQTISVGYIVTGGTATGGGTDYTLATGTLTINEGSSSENITISVVDDPNDEPDETFQVSLANPINASFGADSVHTYTITDNDSAPTVGFSAATSAQAEGTTAVSIPVILSVASGRAITVDYAVSGGTATGGGTDYTLASGTLSFAIGDASETIDFSLNNDALDEAGETIVITVSAPTNATLGTTNHTFTITDDDATPTLSFSAGTQSVSEATTAPTVTVDLSASSGQTVTVNYSVSASTATGGGTDYTLASGTLTFSGGDTSETIPLTIVNDALDEVDETITIELSSASNATLGGTPSQVYTITDNDSAPTVAFTSATSSASEATTSNSLSVDLSAPSGKTITVDYAVTGGTGTSGGTDYTLASGTLTFVAGDTSENIGFTVVNDALDEDDETFVVTISNPTESSLGGQSTHTYTINDNDATPSTSFFVTSASAAESTNSYDAVVELSAVSGRTATVDYTISGTATGSGTDYTLAAGTVTFAPGDTSELISLSIAEDVLDEVNETVIVTLSNPVNTSVGGGGTFTYTILDNDASPDLALDSASSSGSEATTAVNIPVSINAVSGRSVTIDYAVSGGTAVGGGSDFTLASGTLTIPAGDGSEDIALAIVNDLKDESNETVEITLSNCQGCTLVAPTVFTYTINDNDAAPTVQYSAASSNDSEATTSPTINVTLSAPAGYSITVDYAVTGGTATGGGVDYTLASGTLTFAEDDTTESIPLSVVNDTKDEVGETVTLNISNPSAGSLGGQTTHTYTINDNDSAPTVTFAAASQSIGEATSPGTIVVNLSTASGLTATVDYAVTGGTATGGGTDFTLASGTLTFSEDDTSEDISFTVNNDTLDEVDQTFTVTLSNPSNSSLGAQSTHEVTITDNDAPPTVAFGSASSNDSESTAAPTIAVNLSTASEKSVTVDYAVTGGTATGGGTDFTLASGTLTFAAGDASEDIPLSVASDAIDEANETVAITISNPTESSLGATTAHTFTINDDDAEPTISFSAASSDASESVTSHNMTVNLSTAAGRTVTVDYAVTGGSATGGGTDYTLAAGTLTFVAGDTSENIAFTTVNDLKDEINETIVVDLSNPSSGATAVPAQHTFTINDNDATPTVTISATTQSVSEAAGSGAIVVNLSAVSGQTVSVDYAVTGGTATGGGTDYTLAAGTLSISEDSTTGNINFTLNDDALDEASETFTVTISNPSGATISPLDNQVVTITDDDSPPTVSFSAADSNDAEATAAPSIPVTLSAASGQTVTVAYAISGGTGTGSGTDYTLAAGTLTFAGGDTSEDIPLTINGDALDEDNETVEITISGPTNSSLGATTVYTYTINDDDGPPTVQFSLASSDAYEGAGTASAVVTLSAASGKTVTVDYSDAAVNGATGGGTDYTFVDGTVTFTPGDTSESISFTVVDEDPRSLEPYGSSAEGVDITIANPSNATLGATTTHRVSILDDQIATGVGVFHSTALVGGGTDYNPASATAISFASYQSMDSSYFSWDSGNPGRITLLQAGRYFVSVTIPLTSATAGVNSLARVRLNGSNVGGLAGTGAYISAAGSHSEGSIHIAGLVSGVSVNDYIDVTVEQEGVAGTMSIAGQAQVYVEFISSSRYVFKANGTPTPNPAAATNISWSTEVVKDSGFTFSAPSASITLVNGGDYLVVVNLPFQCTGAAVARTNSRLSILIDTVAQAGMIGANSTIHQACNGAGVANSATATYFGIVHDVVAGGVLAISLAAEATATGAATFSTLTNGSVYVEQLSSISNAFSSRSTALTSGTNFNAAAAVQYRWNAVDDKDSNIFTHSGATNPHQVTFAQGGDYLVIFSDYSTGVPTATADMNHRIRLMLDGSAESGAIAANHRSMGSSIGHTETSSSMVYFLRDVKAGDVLTLETVQEATAGTTTQAAANPSRLTIIRKN